LKDTKEKYQLTYKGKNVKIILILSTEILKAKKAWNDKIEAVRENNCKPRILCSA
jgi:uncharacterized protein YegP (UPF0339 family)